MDYALIVLAGNVGSDPQTRVYENERGKGKIVTCTLCVANHYDGPEPRTDYFKLVFKGRNAESAERLLKKGTAILVDGTPYMHQWVDENMEKRTSLRVRVSKWRFAESKRAVDAKNAVLDAAPFGPDFAADLNLDS